MKSNEFLIKSAIFGLNRLSSGLNNLAGKLSNNSMPTFAKVPAYAARMATGTSQELHSIGRAGGGAALGLGVGAGLSALNNQENE